MEITDLYRIAVFGLLISPNAAFSEPTLPDPGGKMEAPFTIISGSDYGPRSFDNQKDRDTNPHKGIDYRIRDNIQGLAVAEGVVTEVRLAGDISHVFIGDWYYVHIATGSRLCSLYASTGTNVVVLRKEVNGVLQVNSVLGKRTRPEIEYFFDRVTTTTWPITTSVSTYTWVFLAHPDQQHLHLQYRNGLENPLKYVKHADDNNPVAVLYPKFKRIGTDGNASDFTDKIIFNTAQPLILQAGVDVTGDKDLDKVEISYKMEGDISFTPLNRWEYEPATTKRYVKSTWAPAGKIQISSMVPIASAAEEGVYPQLNAVSVDFLKYKWNTRLANLSAPSLLLPAPLNSMSQYPDGRYEIQMGARDITEHEISTRAVRILDNYRPYAESVELKDSEGNVKYRRGWTYDNGVLVSPGAAVDEPLLAGTGYTATIAFSEYMEHGELRVGSTGSIYFLAGIQDPALKSTVYTGSFQAPSIQRDELRQLIITGVDPSGNNTLNLGPGKRDGDGQTGFARTIDPSYELIRDDESIMRGVGGEDRFHPLRIDAASPEVSWRDRQGFFGNPCFDGTPERCGSETAPINITFNTVNFRYADIGSGLKSLKIYKEKLNGEVFKEITGLSEPKRAYAYDMELPIPDGKYVQVVTDNLGRATVVYFRVDPVTPRLEVSSITLASSFETYSVYGVVVDTGSGMDSLRLSRINTPDADFSLVSGTTESVNYSFSGLTVGGDGYYVFTAEDKAQNIAYPPLMQFVRMDMGSIMPGPSRAVAHHVTEVRALGQPCDISVTSSRNTLEIPVKYEIGDGTITASLTEATTSTTPVTVAFPDRYIHGNVAIDVSQSCSMVDGVQHCSNACNAWLEGDTILALTLGPAVSVSRYSDVPSSFDLVMKPPMFDFTFENAGWPAGAPPATNVAEANPPPAPWGYVNYPTESPRGWQIETAGLQYDRLSIKVYALPESMSDEDKSRIRLWKYHDGVPSDITTGFEGNVVKGVTYDTSLFTLVAPIAMFDKQGPSTSLSVSLGAVYISTSAPVRLSAVDGSADVNAVAGVATTYYLIDIAPTPECFAVQYDTDAPKGTCANPVYAGAFTLNEGSHTVYALSVDKLGNYGGAISSGVYVDGTAPETGMTAGDGELANGATAYITAVDSITITAPDPVSNGVGSGLAATYMLIDISPEECEYAEGLGGIDGLGSCENPVYTGPFTLPKGEHTVYYGAMDNVGNKAEVKTVNFIVTGVPKVKFYPAAKSIDSILWQWELVVGATGYQVFSSTGGTLSELLAGNNTSYLQSSLMPNTVYSNRLRAYTPEGVYESVISTAATLAGKPLALENFVTGQNAAIVIGQPDFVSNLSGYNNLYQFGQPYSVAIDIWGNLWVIDYQWGRVLRFNPPFTNGMSASVVLGKMDGGGTPPAVEARLRSPMGVSAARDGSLWVTGGSRVLQFKPPFYTGMPASLVIGQPDFTAWEYTSGINRLRDPYNSSADANGSLWVADTANNRVVRFDPPFTNGMDASLVLGQSDFYSGGDCYGVMVPSPDRFCAPSAVTEDEDGDIWVSDTRNGRVLKFKPPFTNSMSASLVIGQKDFNSNCYSIGSCAISANLMNYTWGSVFDNSGNLYVTDEGASRVLKFKPPFTNGMNASVVLGQENFTSSSRGLAANKFWYPAGVGASGSVVIDPAGRLWVADTGNARVLGFNPSGPGAVEAIDWSSLAVSWLAGGNSPSTEYVIKVSSAADFTGDVFASFGANLLTHTFTGLSPNTVYYAKVRAINSEGRETDYVGLGAGRTKPAPAEGLKGVAQSPTSVLWAWDAADKNLAVEIFASTGGSLSGALPAGTTQYLQTGLSPSMQYGVFVRTSNRGGSTDTGVVYQATLANPPARVEAFVNAQPADLVLGQEGFDTYSYGTSQNQLKSPTGATFDNGGNLWVADSNNNRILKFSPPFTNGMNADFVIGQNDFNSGGSGTGADKFNMPAGVAFDNAGNLWIADQYNNRILRFSPPFSGGMGADLVIGQSDFVSASYGTTQNTLWNPQGIAFDAEGGLWVSDYVNSRVLRFNLPFSTGMNASLVLGQPGFTSSNMYAPASPQNLSSPTKIAFDKAGRLWVSDLEHRRVLRFSPPFSNYMPATLVLGQADLNSNRGYTVLPAPNTIKYPLSLTLDAEDNVYVGDAYFHRITKFKAPFSNDMNASLVLGQNSFFTGGYNDPTSSNLYYPAETMINTQDETLWVVDYVRILRFAPKRAFTANISSLTVTWDNNSNSASTEYLVRLSADPGGENSVASSAWQTGLNYVFQNLNSATTCFAFVKARNSAGLEGPEINLGWAVTLAPLVHVAQSTTSINGMPEAVFSTLRIPYISLISSTSEAGSIAIGSATSSGLVLASNIYEIGPEGTYEPPAELVFYYSTSTLSETGLLDADVAVYEYFVSSGWVRLPNQTPDPVNHKITVPITQIASLFGIFGIVQDRTAPVTELRMQDAAYTAQDGKVYMSGKSSITLEAYDPVVYGTSTGVAFIEYRIDPDTSTAFIPYVLPFSLSEGFHVVEYRSRDNIGNLDVIKSTAVYADSGAPATEALLTGTTGQNGWHVSPVTAVLISTDSLSGVKTAYYKVVRGAELPPATTDYFAYSGPLEFNDEGEYVLYYYGEDNIGNIEAVKTTAFKIDLSTPAAAYALNPLPGQAGWNNAPVDVVFTGTDAVSGIEYCSSSFTVTTEGMSIPVSGYCADYAGWSSTVSFVVNMDTAVPSSGVEFAGFSGQNGWYVSPVAVTLISTDNLSGVESSYYSVDGSSFDLYASSFTAVSEGVHSLKYYAVDKAGNSESEKESALKLDMSAPLVTAVSSPTTNTWGWNNTVVTMLFSGADVVSGIAYCEPDKLVSVEGGSQTVAGYCMDYAGWSSTASLAVSIDTTAPNVAYTVEPAANDAGWNNSDVAVKFTCADGLSGVKSCPTDILLAGEGLNISTSAVTYDYAGNTKSTLVAGVNIDKAAPISTAAVSGVYRNGWYSSPVAVVLASTDALSGIQGAFYSLDGGNYAAYTQPVAVFSEGKHLVSYYSEDLAGNRESVKTVEFGIDTTAPVADYLLAPLPNADGWNAGGVSVVFQGSDTLSGIEECSSMTVSVEGKDQKITGWCRDLAGNISYSTVTLNIDLTQPVVSAARIPVPNTYGWNKGAVDISFAGTDTVSGIAYCEPAKSISVEGASQTVSGYCTDYAGWSSTRAFIVNIDMAPPVVSYTLDPAPNEAGWLNTDVAARFTCIDNLSGVRLCPADIEFTGGVNISTAVKAADYADNITELSISGINIDKTAPATRAELSGHSENGWYTSEVLITLVSSDEVSGVKQTTYRLERQAGTGAELVSSGTYAAPLSAVSDGIYTIRYYAEDKAGNKEVEQSLEFKINSVPPEISYSLIPEANAAGWNNSVVEVVFKGTGTLSGIKECSRVTVITEGAGQKIAGYCSDMAGNIAYATATVNVDFTLPVSSALQNPAPNAAGWNNSDVWVVFAGSDVLSGLIYCSPEKTVSAEGASQIVSGYCADYAGNSSTTSITLNIDKTTPLITISSPVAGSLFVAGKDKLEIHLAVDDNLDPAPAVTAVLTQTEDKGALRGSGPASIAVVNGQIIDPLELDDGMWRLEVAAKDIAENSTQAVSGLFEVIHDTIAPETVLLVGEPKFTDVVTFINSGTPLTFSTTADFTYVALDGGTPAAVSGEFFISLEGVHSLAYYSVDNAGNTEVAKSALFSVDNSAPDTSYSISGPVFEGAAGRYVSTASIISFSAVEPASLGAASGFAAIFVADSTDTYTVYFASFTASEGVHHYGYYAKDRLGNTEPARTLTLTADGAPPVSAMVFSSAPASGALGRLIISSDTYIGFAGQDVLSGVAAVWYSIDSATAAVFVGSITLPVGLHEVSYWAVDNVGNTEPAQKASLQVGGGAMRNVTVNFEPSVINLKSAGGDIEATLSVSSASAGEFDAGTIRITKINGIVLAAPIYAVAEHKDKDENGDKGKDKDDDKGRDKKKNKDRHEKAQSIKVKFDRQALIAVLPVDRMVKVTVEGSFDDATAFAAEDYLRVVNPGQVSKGHDGKVRHHSRACADIPAKALKGDAEITVVAMAERDAERREREERAGAKGLKRSGDVYEFGPEGTVFDAPVIISLPYDPLEAGKGKLAIAYWNPSQKDWEPLESELDPVEKVVKAKVAHFSLYQVVAPTLPAARTSRVSAAAPSVSGDNTEAGVLAVSGADPTFKLGEVYVFPNPAKGAQVPMFHIETGIADSVEIIIYTVSGRQAHKHTITGTPDALDDGNGLSYAYEYAWRDHIPSGVYYYSVTAEKAGRKLKKAGKFAIVR